jgi:hypothetical protein
VNNFWRVISTPSCWQQLKPYSETLDVELSKLIDDQAPFERINKHYATIGNFIFWVANHPYASFVIYDSIRPKRKTIFRAMDYLIYCEAKVAK